MQPLGITATEHQPPGELINDDNLAVLDHIIFIAPEKHVGLQGIVQKTGETVIGRIIEIRRLQQSLSFEYRFHGADAGIGQVDVPFFFINNVVHPGSQAGDEAGKHIVYLAGFFRWTADDERSAGLINEQVIHLIHDGVVQLALHALCQVHHHIIAQIVEAEFAARAVGDVGLIRFFPGNRAEMSPAAVS